jgi:transaldolase
MFFLHFIGRLDDISTDGLALIREIRLIYDNYGFMKLKFLAVRASHYACIETKLAQMVGTAAI